MEVINITDSDDSDFVASSTSAKSRGGENSAVCQKTAKTKASRREQMGKKQKHTLNSATTNNVGAPGVSRSRRSRNPKKKKVKPQVLLKKASPVSIDDDIPPALIQTFTRGLCGYKGAEYDIHSSLRGKKVIIYGLTGYFGQIFRTLSDPILHEESKIWRSFKKSRITDPVYEFVEQYEGLKEKGVDHIVFMPVNYTVVLDVIYNHPKLRAKYDFVQFVADIKVGYPNMVSYYDSLGLEMDIQETEWDIPLRARRFVLVVDDLKIKLASIESNNNEFYIPTADEIVESLGG